MNELNLLFIILLFAVAFLYSSVGHGGASGYLALMAVFGFTPSFMKPAALLMNVFVSIIAFLPYYRAGYFRWKLFLPFALASVPAAFAGGFIFVDTHIYKIILGVLLLFPILSLLGVFRVVNNEIKETKIIPALFTGVLIGLLSGMIGIGGGIILSPFILLMRWANMKETAAVSALFIFVNSVSGLAGHASTGMEFNVNLYLLVSIAIAGGIAGSYFGAGKFEVPLLKKMLATVLIIAVAKLFFT